MSKKLSVAILGSTGYVGIELIKILNNHKNVEIVFLGTENSPNISINKFDKSIKNNDLPLTELNKNFQYQKVDTVFLALPHGASNKYVKNLYGKIQIIDLSADFRLHNFEVYKKDYGEHHSCSELLDSFIYGLAEHNKNELFNHKNISVPGCYPTSILIPIIPLLVNNLIKDTNIIIDSKSGYSGAGKKFDIKNIKKADDFNFFNYNTNNHRHISEIKQELERVNHSEVFFSFNPHILPNFRGMMSTIYCDLENNIHVNDVIRCYEEIDENNYFIEFKKNEQRVDFFSVQNTNKCILKIFKHYSESKIIIVSLIDNLQKGAAGQAVQCFNLSNGFEETSGLI
jgi:N-acetyl-gamma-glutamyl-phosphate reductase